MSSPASMFVYGTLRPGQERWPLLAPFVVDDGWDDAVPGQLYDTGHGYPGATFGGLRGGPVGYGTGGASDTHGPHGDEITGRASSTGPTSPTGVVPNGLVIGRTVHLLEMSLRRALEVLDHEEDIVEGLYRRVLVTTRAGTRAWAYEWSASFDLTVIDSGDWCRR